MLSIMIMALFMMSAGMPSNKAYAQNVFVQNSPGSNEYADGESGSLEDEMKEYYDIHDNGDGYDLYFKIISEEERTVEVVDPMGHLWDRGCYSGGIILPEVIEYAGNL